MDNIKLEDLYLSRKESTNIIEFLAKMRNIKNYKANLAINYMKYLKNNQKIKKEWII